MKNKPRKSFKNSGERQPKTIKEPQIDFDSWFWFKVRDGRLGYWQVSEIKVFFAGKGLKDKEPKSKFEDTLKSY